MTGGSRLSARSFQDVAPFDSPFVDGCREPSPAILIDGRAAGQTHHRMREELQSDLACMRSTEPTEEGGYPLRSEAPIVGRKLVDGKEEMRSEKKDAVILQAATQFGEGQPRILHMLDGVDQECGTDRLIANAQAMEIMKLIDAEPRAHVRTAEGAAWKQRTYGGQMGLAGNSCGPEFDNRLWQVVCIVQPFEQIVDDCPHPSCLSESDLNRLAPRPSGATSDGSG